MKYLITIVFFFATFCCNAQKSIFEEIGLDTFMVTDCTPVKDQYMSATCWSFASNSFFESELIKKGKGNLDLSEMFVARYSMKRKIERHLQLKGGNFFTPGGQFHDVVWVMKNYGMVPENVYTGNPKPGLQHNHGNLDTVISHFVKKMLHDGVTKLNERHNKFVDSVLDYYLGIVPTQFKHNGKNITPKIYLKEVLEINPDDYLEITSYTHHPFYTKFVLEDKYNWTGDAYYNVTMDDFSSITDNALKNGYTVEWDGDAEDANFNFNEGLAWMPDPITDYQQYRQEAFKNESTLLDHMMHIVGSANDKYGTKWYYVKNSWGNTTNKLGGYMFMREDYFKIRTVAIIVNKNAIPLPILKKLSL